MGRWYWVKSKFERKDEDVWQDWSWVLCEKGRWIKVRKDSINVRLAGVMAEKGVEWEKEMICYVLEAEIKVKEWLWKIKVQRALMSGFEDVKRKKKVCVIWEGTGMEKKMREKKERWVIEWISSWGW